MITGGTDDIPVAVLALSSDEDLNVLSQKVTDTVAPELKSVPGVRDVTVSGKEEREIVITYKQSKLADYGVDPTTIAQLFAANANAIPSGTMRTDTANLDVQTGTTYSTVDEIKNLRLQGTDGPVKLSELATVKEAPVATTSISRVDGRTSLTLQITKTPDANTVTVAHGIADRLPELERALGNNAKFVTVFDQAPYIEQSVHDLTVEGGIGLAMAVFVILLFLQSLRPTLITAISIPLSLLIALIGLWVGGYTLNILTLAALTVVWVGWRVLNPLIQRRRLNIGTDVKPVGWAPQQEQARALLAEADRLAAEGQYDEATHLLLRRSVEHIAETKPDWVQKASTAREIAAIAGLSDSARSTFSLIATRVERSLFALRRLDAGDWQAAREAYASFALERFAA